ncbi:right-handed parallel beta-helix repeat-containing protein, partial [Planctomycetota bacterium]
MRRNIACALLLFAVAGTAAAAEYSWQRPHAEVLPQGDLRWKPEPFTFTPGKTVRYVDYAGGSDANDGATKQAPWKRHPWDPAATGRAKAATGLAATFVFKRGTVYRGALYVPAGAKGSAEEPIRLTSDPSWGKGEAVLCGSERVTGWTKGADHPDVPDPGKVWHVDLDFAPRNVWMIEPDDRVVRIKLARSPNWEITNPDDIKSEWWTWKNPKKPFDNYIELGGQRRHLAFDIEHINESKPDDYYKDAILWTTKGWVMGSPFPTRVRMVDRERGALAFRGQWGGISYKIIRGCRYYLEDKPHYLDAPGEFWFQKKGNGGRLYIRLPGDRDPNATHVEVAKRIHVVESDGMSHVHISGLTVRFTNVFWDLTATPAWLTVAHKDVDAGCIRTLGSGEDIRVSHCRFEHVHRAIRVKAIGKQDAVDRVVVSDNVFRHTDYGAVEIAEGSHWGDVYPPMGRLYDVRVLRNRFEHIGLRPSRFGQGQALTITNAQTLEVAGNILDRCYSAGINVFGGKASRAVTHRPFVRLLIHHNKVTDPLLNNDDFGGIETWQGGPAYVYNNVSGNPGGFRNWDRVLNPSRENRFGHAYYLQELPLQQHRLGQEQRPGRPTGQHRRVPGDPQLPEHVLQQHDLQLRQRQPPPGAPRRPRQVPRQRVERHRRLGLLARQAREEPRRG